MDASASALVEHAREAVERERATSQPTQTLPATETEVDLRRFGG
jgi:hypothetical protein